MSETLYSIRMFAAAAGSHLSGAERLAPAAELPALAAELVARALEHPRGCADLLRLSIDQVAPAELQFGRLPDLATIAVDDYVEGRRVAARLLAAAGVDGAAAAVAIAAIAGGAATDGRNMRGAMLIDGGRGLRREADPDRGIRATRMDLTAEAAKELKLRLGRLDLDRPQVREALVLAAKVQMTPGVIAELCWSDDPDYTAGYVSSPVFGYLRIPHLKAVGDSAGGRAFFLRPEYEPLDDTVAFLETVPVLFHSVGECRGMLSLEEVLG